MNERLQSSDVEREVPMAREAVRASGLPGLLADVDGGAFGTTSLNLELLDALVRAAAAAAAAARLPKLESAGPVFFAYVMAQEALGRLLALADAPGPSEPTGSLRPDQYKDLGRMRPESLFPAVLKDCAGFVRFYAGHPDSARRLSRDGESLRCLRSYFHLLSGALRRLGPERLDLRLETPRLRFDGWRASPTALEEAAGLLDVSLDDIVGNEAYVAAAKRLARDVAGFDLSRGANPKKVRNQILFVLGSPGCGKTVTAHAVFRYFLDLCERHKVPAKARVIRRTDWASSYQNQSANRLLEIFRDEVFNAPGVCGAYWPDIDTAFSARGDSQLRQEEKSNLGTLFGILDGTVGPKNGKWFLLCDANTMHMDAAMISRLAQTPLQARGPVSPEDYVRLLRDIKLRGKDRLLPVSEEEWAAIGERCVAEGLSGRSIDSVAGRVLTEIEDFEEPEDYFSMPFEEKKRLIDELSRPVGAEKIGEFITGHIRFEKSSQEKSAEERFRRRVSEIRLHLSAQRAALGGPGLDAESAKKDAPDGAPKA
ncbi:MAG: AAA family ATPase [Elusimicrobiota bacterium]